MTALALARAQQAHGGKGRNKYGAKKVVLDGIKFDSTKEANRYMALKNLVRAGEITNLERQPVFKLAIDGRPVLMRSERYPNGRQAKYVADFAYRVFKTGERVVEDVKSPATRTAAYVLKRAVVEAMIPGLRIVEV